MSKLPLVTGTEMCRLLENIGFIQKRQRGSHICMAHEDGRTVIVPVHANEQLGRGLIRALLREVKLSTAEYISLRQS